MPPSYYEFFSPVKILSGIDALDHLPHEFTQLGARRPLLISERNLVRMGLLAPVHAAFAGHEIAISAEFLDVPPDSADTIVDAVADLYRRNGCDSLLAVGGGSVIDTAKGVNIVVSTGVAELRRAMGAETIQAAMKPLIVVPTTAGTGSEATLVAVIADPRRHVKMAFTSYKLVPNAAVLDPRMTLTLPPRLTAATGMDALTHAIEAYTCLQKNPVSDAFAWSAVQTIARHLLPAVQNGADARLRLAMANASLLAGIAFSNSMVGLVHSLGHALGGMCGVPHGVAMGILLPHVMAYNTRRVGDLYGELLLPLADAEIFSRTLPGERPTAARQAVETLLRELHRCSGLPITLAQAGVTHGQLPDVARAALDDGSLVFNPMEVEYNEALAILQRAME